MATACRVAVVFAVFVTCSTISGLVFAQEADRVEMLNVYASSPDATERTYFYSQTGDEEALLRFHRKLVKSGARAVNCFLPSVIVCGLPWASFDARRQDALMSATVDALGEGGQFVTFAYLQGLMLPAGRRFAGRLNDWFSRVSRSPVVWRNLPPAFVYQCTK